MLRYFFGLGKILWPSIGECRGQEAGVGGLGIRAGVGIEGLGDSLWNVNEENI